MSNTRMKREEEGKNKSKNTRERARKNGRTGREKKI